MLKKKLLLIFILIFGGLALITYAVKTNLLNLSIPKKELANKHSISNDIIEIDTLDSESDVESSDNLANNTEVENGDESIPVNEETTDQSINPNQQELNEPIEEETKEDIKEIESEDWKNWRPGISTLQMLLPNVNSEPRTETTTHVVMHFASNAANNPTNPYNINDTYSIFQQYEVSSHYVIDRSGQVYLFVPETRVAYHAGRGTVTGFPTHNNRLNHYSIGIELLAIGTKVEMTPVITGPKFDLIPQDLIGYTDSQYSALNILLDDILKRNPNIKRDRNHIIGHDEYNPSKTDPGSLFDWSKISL